MAKFTKAQRAEIQQIVTDTLAHNALKPSTPEWPTETVGGFSPIGPMTYKFAFTTTPKPECFSVEYIEGYGLKFSDNRLKILSADQAFI